MRTRSLTPFALVTLVLAAAVTLAPPRESRAGGGRQTCVVVERSEEDAIRAAIATANSGGREVLQLYRLEGGKTLLLLSGK